MVYDVVDNSDMYVLPLSEKVKEKLPFSIFLLFPFLIGSIAISALPGFNYLVVGFGIVCTIVFLMASLREGFYISGETKCFMAFICWGILGLFFAESWVLASMRLLTLFQIFVMALIVSYYAQNTRCIVWLYGAVLIGILVLALSAVITGEFARSEVDGEGARVSGLILNANAFARAVCYGIAVLLFYFRHFRSWLIRLLMLGGILVAVRFLIASGSRQGFLGFVSLLVFWFIFSYGKEFTRRPFLVIGVLVGMVGLGVYVAYESRDTVLMQRLLRLEGGAEAEGSAGSRLVMLREGLGFMLSNPLLGIGLNNFIIRSVTELYAHNNYIEVFSTTGIVGGLLYHLIYVLIFYRFHRLRKLPLNQAEQNVLNVFYSAMIMTVLFDLFVVSYYSKITWIMLAIIIGYLNALQRELLVRQAVESPPEHISSRPSELIYSGEV